MANSLRSARGALLIAGFLLAAVSGAVAGGATPDDTARLLAGLKPADASPLAKLAQEGGWQRHAKRFDQAWAELDKTRLEKIRAWATAHIPQAKPVVYYMFSGPDYLYADAFFPDAETYILSGLEPVGEIPNVEGLSRGSVGNELERMQQSLNSALSYSFFITRKMKTQLRNGRLSGTLPLLYVFLARSGKTVKDVSLVTLSEDGTIQPEGTGGADGKDAKRSAAKGAKIIFTGKDGKERVLYYFSTDLSDDGVKRSGFLKFCDTFGHGDSLLKSASYLLHSDNFATVREFVLDHSDALVQDDSGIPLRFFKDGEWKLYPFGAYLRPLGLFPRTYQPALQQLYRKEYAGPLNFGIGYRWRPNQSNLLLAIRSKRTAQGN
jgi:hypothetical protein